MAAGVRHGRKMVRLPVPDCCQLTETFRNRLSRWRGKWVLDRNGGHDSVSLTDWAEVCRANLSPLIIPGLGLSWNPSNQVAILVRTFHRAPLGEGQRPPYA